jgi:hypothetical protein
MTIFVLKELTLVDCSTNVTKRNLRTNIYIYIYRKHFDKAFVATQYLGWVTDRELPYFVMLVLRSSEGVITREHILCI